MHWLEEQELKKNEWNDLLNKFDKSIVNAKNIYERIRQAFRSPYRVDDYFKSTCKFQGPGINSAHWTDKYHERYSCDSNIITLSVTNKQNLPQNPPSVQLLSIQTTWAYMYQHDDSEETYRTIDDKSESIRLETNISIDNLNSIPENEWITIFGWLFGKSEFYEVHGLLKKYSVT